MELDLEQIAVVLQRRYDWLREVKRLTGEMQEAVSRNDEVSFALLLQMRAEVLAKYDASKEELWSQAEKGSEVLFRLKTLLKGEMKSAETVTDFMEKKIYEIRKKTNVLIREIQKQDKILRFRVNNKR